MWWRRPLSPTGAWVQVTGSLTAGHSYTLTLVSHDDYYPGDSRPSQAWPGFAPGDRGVLNTMAPTHFRIADLSGVRPKPPVLWLRGADDVIVSDTSLYDLAYLGSLGAIPGWPDLCSSIRGYARKLAKRGLSSAIIIGTG